MVDAALAQDAHLHGDAELDVADDAVAAAVLAVAAAAGAQAEFAEEDRVAALEDFGVGDARVGHVRVDAVGAVPGGAGAGAAGYGLVVAEAFCGGVGVGVGVAAEAEGEVVAVALGGGAGGEGEEDDVGDALGGEDVAADDGGVVGGGEEGFGGDEDADRFEAALVQGDVVFDEAAEAVDDGGVGDGFGGVGVGVDLGAGAGEVEDGFASGGVDGDFEVDGAAVVHVVGGCEVLAFEPLADVLEEVADAEFGVVLDVAHVELDDLLSVVFYQGADQVDAFLVGGDLGFEIVEVVRQTSCSAALWILRRLVVE